MLPQPPPNAPAPPPSEAALRSRRWMSGLLSVGVISILTLFAFLLTPQRRGPHYNSEAHRNAREIGLALFEFELEFETYPNSTTLAEVQARNATGIILGTKSSNDFFRQLIAAGMTDSERPFYAKIPGAKEPDDVILPGQALEKGECAFSYLISNIQSYDRPVVVTPLIPGTNRFDPKPFRGKAIVLFGDQSVRQLDIDKDGHVRDGGIVLLGPSHPVWGGKGFTIAWPE